MYEATACGTRTYIHFPNIETCTAVNTVMHIVACTHPPMLAMWPPHVAQRVCMKWGSALHCPHMPFPNLEICYLPNLEIKKV